MRVSTMETLHLHGHSGQCLALGLDTIFVKMRYQLHIVMGYSYRVIVQTLKLFLVHYHI